MKLIPENWKTDRLIISDLKENEISLFQDVFQSSSYINQWSGRKYDPDYVKKCFYEGNLPPEGKHDNYSIQAIRTIEEQSPIGVNVDLKNWPAIRFWVKSGFDKISGVYGDDESSDNTFANIELIKTI